MKKIYPYFLLLLIALPVIAQSSVMVITPNGGENWIIGCPNTIQWISSTPVTVKIELYKNGVFYMTICNQVPATQNSYIWTPPYSVIPGNTFKVKVTCLSGNTSGYDFSNANFSINLGTITVVSPNGGEIWQIGSTYQILWTDNICENVRIELWKGGILNTVISASTPSTGLFTWTIPNTNTIVPGNDYKIKIQSVAMNSGSTNIVYDFSDANFTINTGCITVLVPNGGENWIAGNSYAIAWIDCVSENVRIELWKGGMYNSLICNSGPANGTFLWTIPAATVAGNDYKVKVIGLTSSGNFDFSDNNFTISQGYFITVTSPNGGEIWIRGTTRIITWLDNIPYNVRIELWKGGAYNSLISASTPSNGSCYWAIPATQQPGIDYKVKIMAISPNNNTIFDFSDNNFSVLGSNAGPSTQKSTPTESSGNDIKIFPNPCNNHLQVTIPNNAISGFSIEMMNMTGKIALQDVVRGSSDTENYDINTSALADGMYIFVIRIDNLIVFRNAVFVHH